MKKYNDASPVYRETTVRLWWATGTLFAALLMALANFVYLVVTSSVSATFWVGITLLIIMMLCSMIMRYRFNQYLNQHKEELQVEVNRQQSLRDAERARRLPHRYR